MTSASGSKSYRLLLQAVALARLVFALRKSGFTEHPFVVAVYLTGSMTAERYIVMKSKSDEVFISHKNFDLVEENDAIDFQREMYNLASMLESLIIRLDVEKCDELAAVKQDALGMQSFQTESKGGRMDSITDEEDAQSSMDEDEDDLGIFDSDNVRAALNKMNYRVAYVAYGYPHVAPIMSRTNGKLVGCLKFVKDGAKEKEIETLQYFAGLPSEFNHCVRPFGIWPVTGGSIIAMLAAGNRLNSLTDLDGHLWPLTTQLFEGVKFMHDHNVAYMDLKPANILVSTTYGRLTILDFGISVRLKNKTQLLEGYAGTKGYIAPEVGKTRFSPIHADLWSVGKVVKELCMLCRPSTSRDWLLDLSERQLLNDDPSKRPMMSEVLEWMLKLDASKT